MDLFVIKHKIRHFFYNLGRLFRRPRPIILESANNMPELIEWAQEYNASMQSATFSNVFTGKKAEKLQVVSTARMKGGYIKQLPDKAFKRQHAQHIKGGPYLEIFTKAL